MVHLRLFTYKTRCLGGGMCHPPYGWQPGPGIAPEDAERFCVDRNKTARWCTGKGKVGPVHVVEALLDRTLAFRGQ